MPRYKFIEVSGGARTGRSLAVDAVNLDGAVAVLCREMGLEVAAVEIAPTRTMLRVGAVRWTVVRSPSAEDASGHQRRGGQKHRTVR